TFGVKVPFEEYLLAQLKSALGQQDEFHADRPLDVIAAGLTRRLLPQAILAARPTDRLAAFRPRGLARLRTLCGGRNRLLRRLRMLWGGGNRPLRRLEVLLAQIADPSLSRDLPALLTTHGLAPECACLLVEGHLRCYEVGTDLQVSLRRKLYAAMARSVLLRD